MSPDDGRGAERDVQRNRRIDRRAFLMRGAALGVGAVAWACTRGGDDPADPTTQPSAAQAISVLAGAPTLAIGDTRQAFVVLRGQRPIAPSDIEVRLVPPGGDAFDVTASHQQTTRGLGGETDVSHTHAPGTEVEDFFTVRHDFDRAGAWNLDVRFDGGRGSAAFQIVEDTPSPKPGDEALATKSPTTDDARGVDPICTRDPVCTMHDVTIAEALERSKPLIITFATPRFCVSRACGPVVDLLDSEKARVGDKASFVHVEVWKNDDDAVNKVPAPAFAEWKFDGEPWTYFVDRKGIVAERWLGPVGGGELSKAIDALIEA